MRELRYKKGNIFLLTIDFISERARLDQSLVAFTGVQNFSYNSFLICLFLKSIHW